MADNDLKDLTGKQTLECLILLKLYLKIILIPCPVEPGYALPLQTV